MKSRKEYKHGKMTKPEEENRARKGAMIPSVDKLTAGETTKESEKIVPPKKSISFAQMKDKPQPRPKEEITIDNAQNNAEIKIALSKINNAAAKIDQAQKKKEARFTESLPPSSPYSAFTTVDMPVLKKMENLSISNKPKPNTNKQKEAQSIHNILRSTKGVHPSTNSMLQPHIVVPKQPAQPNHLAGPGPGFGSKTVSKAGSKAGPKGTLPTAGPVFGSKTASNPNTQGTRTGTGTGSSTGKGLYAPKPATQPATGAFFPQTQSSKRAPASLKPSLTHNPALPKTQTNPALPKTQTNPALSRTQTNPTLSRTQTNPNAQPRTQDLLPRPRPNTTRSQQPATLSNPSARPAMPEVGKRGDGSAYLQRLTGPTDAELRVSQRPSSKDPSRTREVPNVKYRKAMNERAKESKFPSNQRRDLAREE
ncbi:hypothetical protein NEDG_00485 [Nematocida displodere]|uniref:Uncharacterized protein n=1 Tax=Nematocida displodere TaxID=1805483 RepID=A0A177EKW2_9MICR|nr:hypothetical protein NEDG_00485 [Nematocida displodere]